MSINQPIYPNQSELTRIFSDCFDAAKAWKVWWYMGMQDIRNQFRRSRVGSGWVLIHLTLMATSLSYVYGHLFHQDISVFFPGLLLGIVLWTFMVSTLVQGCQAFLTSEGYIKQFCYPKQVYLLRFLTTVFFNVFIGFLVYFIVVLFIQPQIKISIPIALLGFALLTLVNIAHLIIASYWGTRFRDLSPALGGLFQVAFYLTPVIFTTELLDSQGLSFVYLYNPFYYLLEIVRYPLTKGYFPPFAIYKFVLLYGICAWTLAVFTMLKSDSKVAYWL